MTVTGDEDADKNSSKLNTVVNYLYSTCPYVTLSLKALHATNKYGHLCSCIFAFYIWHLCFAYCATQLVKHMNKPNYWSRSPYAVHVCDHVLYHLCI